MPVQAGPNPPPPEVNQDHPPPPTSYTTDRGTCGVAIACAVHRCCICIPRAFRRRRATSDLLEMLMVLGPGFLLTKQERTLSHINPLTNPTYQSSSLSSCLSCSSRSSCEMMEVRASMLDNFG
jgi:hypothetical protein